MSDTLSRRALLVRTAGLALSLSGLPRLLSASPARTAMLVYKDPGCGCCEKWVELMRAAGFIVSVRNTTDMDPIKRRYHVTPALVSCHTALVEGYVIEGHVPADLIQKVVREKPAFSGLAVPGMVTGSPGMEGPNPQPYQVLRFGPGSTTAVYARR